MEYGTHHQSYVSSEEIKRGNETGHELDSSLL